MDLIVESKRKLRALNLYRVSTERQGADDDIPVQKSECRRYAEANGWEVVEEITEKISGYNTPIEDRDSLYRIKDMAVNGEIDLVVAYMSDRIGRQTELAGYIQGLAMLGVKVYTVKEGLIGGLEHNDTLMTYIKFWMAEGESKKTSTRVKDTMKKLNEDGYFMGGSVPYGYTLEDTGIKLNSKKAKTLSKIVPLEEEAVVVKLIFQLILEKGWGASRIAKHLNDLGYTNKGKVFRHNTISRMLRNPTYMGYKRYSVTEKMSGRTKKRVYKKKDEWQVQPFNADLQLVDEDSFYKVQEILDSRVPSMKPDPSKANYPTKSVVLLSGLVKCGICGGNLRTCHSNKTYKRKTDGGITKSKVFRYSCNNARNYKDHGKNNWGTKKVDEIVEQQVIDTLSQIDLDKLEQGIDSFQQSNIKEKEQELTNLTKLIQKKTTAQENANKELELFMMGESDFTKEQLVTLLNKLSKELMELQKKRKDVEEELNASEYTLNDIVSFKERFKDWGDIYKASDLDTKKMMIASVVKEVVLHVDKIVIHFKIGIQEALNKSVNASATADGTVISGMYKDGEVWKSEHETNHGTTHGTNQGSVNGSTYENGQDMAVGDNLGVCSLSHTHRYSCINTPMNISQNITDLLMSMGNRYRAVEFIVEVDRTK